MESRLKLKFITNNAIEQEIALYTAFKAPTGDILKQAMVKNKDSEKGYMFKNGSFVETSLEEMDSEIERYMKRHCGADVEPDILYAIPNPMYPTDEKARWESF